MAKSSLLTGVDRVEYLEKIGRKIRHGSLKELGMPDQKRLIAWIQDDQFEKALDLIEVLRPLHIDMCTILLEWALEFPEVLRQRVGAQGEASVTDEVYKTWRAVVLSDQESPEQAKAGEDLLKIMDPKSFAQRQEGCRERCERMNQEAATAWKDTVDFINEKKKEEAIEAFKLFILKARYRHDFLCQYLWVYPSVINKSYGQKISEEVMYEAFEASSSYQVLFPLIMSMSIEERVAFLGEHLRGHFSGDARGGEVIFEEQEQFFDLNFGPCGSGGAMRQKAQKQPMEGLENYAQATPSTWMMAGKVPTYCAHCAQNEIASIQYLGYPAWVVKFDPDPMKPCVWRVYKDPADIPEKYYERLGLKKDVSKIKKANES